MVLRLKLCDGEVGFWFNNGMTGKSHPLRPLRGQDGFCDFDNIDVYQSNEVVYVRGIRKRPEVEQEYLCFTRQPGHVTSRPLIYSTPQDISNSTDKRLASDIHAVLGLIQLLQGFYLLVVTEARPVGWIGGRGCHRVWAIEKTALLPLRSQDQPQGSILQQRQLAKDEKRFLDLLQGMEASRGFYFCHTYDLSKSVQANLEDSGDESYLSRFVWNFTHSEGFRNHIDERVRQWYVPMIYGYFVARDVSALSRVLSIILIARRSRLYAGTRYRKRGINAAGDAANEVETEQILIDLSTGKIGKKVLSSFVQVRGSAPVFWVQDQSQLSLVKPRPPILFLRTDRNSAASKRHFSGLLGRYGAPILVVNLTRHSEGHREEMPANQEDLGSRPNSISSVENEQEYILGSHFQKMIGALNSDLPASVKIRYVVFDLKAYSKHLVAQNRLKRSKSPLSPAGEIVDHLGMLAEWLGLSTGWLHIDIEGEVRRFQSGVTRSSCVDCLDRTNVFQYHIGQAVLSLQLRELGLLGALEAGGPQPLMVMRELAQIYEEMGDQLALQYAGSEAHKKYANIMGIGRAPTGTASLNQKSFHATTPRVKGNGTDWPTPSTPSKELLISLHRHYANNVSDQEKQHAVNLFLGLYAPLASMPRPWMNDCDIDAFVHHQPLGDDPMDSEVDWWALPLSEFKQACVKAFAGTEAPAWFGAFPEYSEVREEGNCEVEGQRFEEVYCSESLTRFDGLQPSLRSCGFIDIVPRGPAEGFRIERVTRHENDIFDPAGLHSIKLSPLQMGVSIRDDECQEELLQRAVKLEGMNCSAREVEERLLGRGDRRERMASTRPQDTLKYREHCDVGRLSRMVDEALLARPDAKGALAEHWCMLDEMGKGMVCRPRPGKVAEVQIDERAFLRNIIEREVKNRINDFDK